MQQKRGVLSAEVEISAQMSLINALELEREQKLLDLAQIEANSRPNDTRVAVMRADLERISARIGVLRAALTESSDTNTSLALITGELAVAEADLATRQLMLQTALQQVETARIEANRQVLYLATAVTRTIRVLLCSGKKVVAKYPAATGTRNSISSAISSSVRRRRRTRARAAAASAATR